MGLYIYEANLCDLVEPLKLGPEQELVECMELLHSDTP